MVTDKLSITVIFASGKTQAKILETIASLPSLNLINHSCHPEKFLDLQSVAPDLMLVELDDATTIPDWLEKLPQRLSVTKVILCSHHWQSDLLIQAAQAGFQEFLSLPFSASDLADTVKRLGSAKGARQTEPGHLVAVTGYKGGVGVTTVAINLAVALGEQCNRKVALVDFGRPFPDIAEFLDQEVSYSLTDIIKGGGNVDETFLDKVMQPYGPNLDILNRSNDVNNFDQINNDFISYILDYLRYRYYYVIIDLGQSLDDLFITILAEADMVLMLSGLSVTDIKNLKLIWPLLGEWAGGFHKIKVVVNRLNKGNSIQLNSLKQITNGLPFESLPSDYHLLMDALVQGAPLGVSAPRSKLWHKIRDLAQKVHGQLQVGSEAVEADKIAETPTGGLSWFLPQHNRLMLVTAFGLSLAVLSLYLWLFLGWGHPWTTVGGKNELAATSSPGPATVPHTGQTETLAGGKANGKGEGSVPMVTEQSPPRPGEVVVPKAITAPGGPAAGQVQPTAPPAAPESGKGDEAAAPVPTGSQPAPAVPPPAQTGELAPEKTSSGVPAPPAQGGQEATAADQAGSGAAPPPGTESEPKYVGSITSDKYHYPDCKWAKTIRPEKLISFKSVAEAKEKGYRRCPTCTPPRED
jgi:pilus assembly protein CpaE